jgi:hypothetical protein
MTIAELETVLAARGLTAVREEYTTKEWWAIQGWPRPGRKQGDTPIVVLRVKNPLHGKDLCFEFPWNKGNFLLWNMYFGDYDYEWFHDRCPVAEEIDRVLRDGLTIVTWSKVRYVPHGIYSAYWISDDPEEDDSHELAEVVARLRKKAAKGAWLFGKEGKFEVYSWNTYECIAPEKRK